MQESLQDLHVMASFSQCSSVIDCCVNCGCRRNELVALDLFLTAVATVFAFVSMVVSWMPAGNGFQMYPFFVAAGDDISASTSD